MGIVLRGILALLFGFVAIFWPNVGLQLLVLVFGAYAFIDGLFALFVGATYKSLGMIVEGLIGILVGGYIFFMTEQAVTVFLVLVGIWALATGAFEILAGLQLRKHMENEIFLLFVGIISMLFGALIFIKPLVFASAIAFVIGIYAVVFGIFIVALGLTIKSYKGR